MHQEKSLTSLILKKQAFNEGDELITLYTRQAGKVRVLAKSLKLSKSKLQYALQSLFISEVVAVGSGLPKVINAEIKKTFPYIRESLQASVTAFYVIELILKSTADELPNESLFDISESFLNFINQYATDEDLILVALVKFQMEFLTNLGFEVLVPAKEPSELGVGFSNSHGGFTTEDAADYNPVSTESFNFYKILNSTPFTDIQNIKLPDKNSKESLQSLLNSFISYQLERDIKSESLLNVL